VFLAALGSYGLIKIVPFWGLSLIGTCVLYMAPLLYMKNRGTIKAQLQRIEQVVTRQAYQLKDITAQQASRATETAKTLASDASSKAQQIVGSTKDTVAQQASRATETAQNLVSDASSKAQQIAGATKDTVAEQSSRATETAQNLASNASSKAQQIAGSTKDTVAQQASRASESARNYTGDASSKAQQVVGSSKTSGPSMTNSSIRYEDTAPGMSMGNNSRFESASRTNTQASQPSQRLSNDDFPTALRDSVALPHFDDGDLPSVPFQEPGRTTTTSTFPTTTIPASTGPYIREEEIRTKY